MVREVRRVDGFRKFLCAPWNAVDAVSPATAAVEDGEDA